MTAYLSAETSMSSLDSIIKNSLGHACSHTRNVYGQNPLSASEVIELANNRVLTVASTVRPESRPHLSSTNLTVADGVFCLGVDGATARYRNLKRNPAITVMLADSSRRHALLEGRLEGSAKFLGMKSETAKREYGWVTDAPAEFQLEKIFT